MTMEEWHTCSSHELNSVTFLKLRTYVLFKFQRLIHLPGETIDEEHPLTLSPDLPVIVGL